MEVLPQGQFTSVWLTTVIKSFWTLLVLAGKVLAQIEKNLREADDVLVVFPGDCFSEDDDAAVFLKELRIALSLSNRIIPIFMKEFNRRALIPEDIKPIMDMEGIMFMVSDTSFDENIMRLHELLVSVPVHKPSHANTIEFFNEVTENEALYAGKKANYPEFIREHLTTIMPLFSGIPYSTDKRSVETTLSAPEYYLAFPADLLSSISFSKSSFSPVDINLDQYIQKTNPFNLLSLKKPQRFYECRSFVISGKKAQPVFHRLRFIRLFSCVAGQFILTSFLDLPQQRLL